MSDRQELIAQLRRWANNADRPSEAEVFLAAATALEEAQGVPREPTREMIAAGVRDVRKATRLDLHGKTALIIWRAMYDAAPAAPTREPVSAAVQRDEQDAKRLDWLSENLLAADFEYPHSDSGCVLIIRWPRNVSVGGSLRANVDAAIAEPKR